ncbi:hypothetical protein MJC1_00148 [Methylocystis sp. MJC1]|nr:hypothetical protein MJC1_00148 [Methylocystis sp. MJC1]
MGSAVIPDARKASDRESRAKPTLFPLWISGLASSPGNDAPQSEPFGRKGTAAYRNIKGVRPPLARVNLSF